MRKAMLKAGIQFLRFAYQQWIMEDCYIDSLRFADQIGIRRVTRSAKRRARSKSKYFLKRFEQKYVG